MGTLLREAAARTGAPAWMGAHTRACRALVPLGLPALSGLTRRPVVLRPRETGQALRKLADEMAAARLRPGPPEDAGAAGTSERWWGRLEEPDYGERPAPLWAGQHT